MNRPQFFPVMAFLAILFAAFALSACGHKVEKPTPPPMSVVVRPLAEQNVADMSEYMATLISRQSVDMQSRVTGQVKAIYVKAGDKVNKGDLLMLVDPNQQEAAVQSASASAQSEQAGISQATRNLQSLQEQRAALQSAVETSQLQYNRYERLVSLNSASQQDLERYHNELNQAKANLSSNSSQIQAQQAAISSAKSQYQQALASTRQQRELLQFYRITAPFSGFVGDVPIKVGNYVQPLTKLLNVTDNNSLELNISIPSEYMTRLHPGLPIELVDEAGMLLSETKVSFIAPNVDATAQTILVKAIIPNPKGILKASQIVNARVIWQDLPGLMIPSQAVVRMGGRDFAYVVDKTKAAPEQKAAPAKGSQYSAYLVPVKLGRLVGPSYILESGLKKGQWLVIAGTQKLADAAPVNPKFEPTASTAPQESTALTGE